MKKLIFFISLSLLTLVGCEKNYERTIWINPNVECCGVKDPLNNLKWLKESSKFDEYNAGEPTDYNFIFLFRNNETQKDHIVINRYSRVSWVNIYDCEGNYIDGGHCSIQNQTKFMSPKLKNDPPEPCDTCHEFFKTHTLIDTIAYSMVKS
jgi:hypothetical protein